MRPPNGEEETPAPVSKPAKDNKRKRTSTSGVSKPKKIPLRKPKTYIVALLADLLQKLREEEEEEGEDGYVLVARVKKTIDAPKAAESLVVNDVQPRAERVMEKDSGTVLSHLRSRLPLLEVNKRRACLRWLVPEPFELKRMP